MIRNIILYITFLLLITSCHVLTTSQIKAVNQFATASSNFSNYPSAVMENLAAIRVTRGAYYANSLDDAVTHKNELDSIFIQQIRDRTLNQKVDISYKIIDKYAQTLKLLSSDKFSNDLKEQTENFGKGLDDLVDQYISITGVSPIPSGLGDPIGKLILLGGKQYIKSKQAKEIKKFVPKADKIISVMTSNIVEFLESQGIATLISIEENGISDNYTSYLRQRRSSVYDELQYLALKDQMREVKQLRNQTVKATHELRAAHGRLLEKIMAKRNLKDVIDEIQQLGESVKELQVSISKLNKQ